MSLMEVIIFQHLDGTAVPELTDRLKDYRQLLSPYVPEMSTEPPVEIPLEETETAASVPAEESEPVLPEPADVEPQPAFLQRAATAGGGTLEVNSSAANTRFLRPVGRRNIGEVEVPETERGPVPISRSTASGLGPDKPGEDRATPAYIRKYMD